MKKKGIIIAVITLLLIFYSVSCQSTGDNEQQENRVPFSRGVHFGGWFEIYVNNVQDIQFGRYTEQDFINVKNLGIDVIRLPVDFEKFTSGTPLYIIDPLLFWYLDIVMDWAEKYQIYILIGNHPVDQPEVSPDYRNFLIPIWTQVAEHYKNRSEYVIYEILIFPRICSSYIVTLTTTCFDKSHDRR